MNANALIPPSQRFSPRSAEELRLIAQVHHTNRTWQLPMIEHLIVKLKDALKLPRAVTMTVSADKDLSTAFERLELAVVAFRDERNNFSFIEPKMVTNLQAAVERFLSTYTIYRQTAYPSNGWDALVGGVFQTASRLWIVAEGRQVITQPVPDVAMSDSKLNAGLPNLAEPKTYLDNETFARFHEHDAAAMRSDPKKFDPELDRELRRRVQEERDRTAHVFVQWNQELTAFVGQKAWLITTKSKRTIDSVCAALVENRESLKRAIVNSNISITTVTETVDLIEDFIHPPPGKPKAEHWNTITEKLEKQVNAIIALSKLPEPSATTTNEHSTTQ